MPKGLSGVEVGNVDFQNGRFDAPDCVRQSDGRVRQCARVQDNSEVIFVKTDAVNFVQKQSFVVALEIFDGY